MRSSTCKHWQHQLALHTLCSRSWLDPGLTIFTLAIAWVVSFDLCPFRHDQGVGHVPIGVTHITNRGDELESKIKG